MDLVNTAKELKAAKAQAEEKVKLLKEEHKRKLSDLEKKRRERQGKVEVRTNDSRDKT